MGEPMRNAAILITVALLSCCGSAEAGYKECTVWRDTELVEPSGVILKKGERVGLVDQGMGWTFIIYGDTKFGIIRTGNINDCRVR
jgi:hypothetical protein